MTSEDHVMDLRDRVIALLDAHSVMSLATCGPDGPHAANLFYARDGLELIWVSDGGTRHSRDLAVSADVAVTIAPDTADFASVRGVQGHGRAWRVTDLAEAARLRRLLAQRYPFLSRLNAAPAVLYQAFARIGVYRLVPTRLVLIDNSRSFGHKETLQIEPAAAGEPAAG